MYALDPTPSKLLSIIVLKAYAGTMLPGLLVTQYADRQSLLAPALEAIAKFDFWTEQENARAKLDRYATWLLRTLGQAPTVEALRDPRHFTPLDEVLEAQDGVKRGAAVAFLVKFQNDNQFKAALEMTGARLIPALSTGKIKLADVLKNPKWIDKYVTQDGKPRGEPWWVYVPGGSIVLLVRENISGRPVTWTELGWAGVDAVTIVFIAGKAVAVAKGGVTLASRQGVRLGLKAGGRSILRREAAAIAAGTTRRVVVGSLMGRAYALLLAAGRRPVSYAFRFAKATGRFVVKHPWKAAIAGFSAYVLVKHWDTIAAGGFPDPVEFIRKAGEEFAKVLAGVAVGIPAPILDAIIKAMDGLARQYPLLAPVFYGLMVLLILAVILLPLALLKVFLPPVYDALVGLLRGVFSVVTAPLRRRPAHSDTGARG